MLHGEVTLGQIAAIHREMGLPEPFIWVHREDGFIAGVIEGWIEDGVNAVDHMIVLPSAKNRLRTLLKMSTEATKACHARGLDVVIKIALEDPRRHGLEAWAKRQNYEWYAYDGQFSWYINRKESSPNG